MQGRMLVRATVSAMTTLGVWSAFGVTARAPGEDATPTPLPAWGRGGSRSRPRSRDRDLLDRHPDDVVEVADIRATRAPCDLDEPELAYD